jgi:ABC-type sugar transport system ATPase subunit
MANVQFKKVVKSYGDTLVVPEMDLLIPDGEFTVLVGPSGCGKSTTLRMVAGLEESTKGDIYIGDKRVNDVLPRDRNIAMVFQSYALYPHMTVRENMAFGLKLRKTPKKEINKRVKEVSLLLGLDDYLDRKPKALSGGQRQRVAMGRAIVRRPEVFLFDEPLSNLDAKLRGEMRREIAKLHQTLKTTILYVTHDQVEAMTLADNIVVLNKGHIMQIGPPLVLYHKPQNRFVAGFIGSPSMNFFQLDVDKDKNTLNGKNFSLKIPDLFDTENHKSLDLGIRPGDIKTADSASGDGTITCTVEVIEPLGAEIIITGTTCLGNIMASVSPLCTVKIGEEIHLQFPPDKIHLFDKNEDGASLRKEEQ